MTNFTEKSVALVDLVRFRIFTRSLNMFFLAYLVKINISKQILFMLIFHNKSNVLRYEN